MKSIEPARSIPDPTVIVFRPEKKVFGRVTAPVTVRVIPLLMITVLVPETVDGKVKEAQVASAATVTVAPAAIFTSSVEDGATPPTHVPPVAQSPPEPVLVIVAPFRDCKDNSIIKRKIP